MTLALRESKVLRLAVVTALAVVMGLLFAAPSGAIDNCYPSCTTTTVADTTTSTTAVKTTEAAVTSTTGVAGSSHEDSGSGSLPVTGGDIVGLALLGAGIALVGSTLLVASKRSTSAV